MAARPFELSTVLLFTFTVVFHVFDKTTTPNEKAEAQRDRVK